MKIGDMLRENVELDVMGTKIVYNAQRLTVADLEVIDAMSEDDPHAMDNAFNLMLRLVVSWEIEDDDGPIPVSREGFRRLPAIIAMAIFQALTDDVLPSRAEGNALEKPSERPSGDFEADSEISRSGSHSSRELATLASLLGNLPASPQAG